MKKQHIPYLLMGLVVLLAFVAEIFLPKPVDWTPSLDGNDKRPLGLYILKHRLSDLFPPAASGTSYQTVYELNQADSSQGKAATNLLLVGQNIQLDGEDLKGVLRRADAGASVLLSGHFFTDQLYDTLGFTVKHLAAYLGDGLSDSVMIRFTGQQQAYWYPLHHLMTSLDSLPAAAEVLAEIPGYGTALARIPFGKGEILLNTSPYAFTNYYLLKSAYRPFAEGILRTIPFAGLHWTEYYQMGRMESGSPLRYILQQPALRLGYYLLMGSVLILLLMGSRRLQRAIPVIEKPRNRSLQFAETLGNLFYRNANHKAMAEKRILFLNEHLYRQYRLLHQQWTPELLNKRTGLSETQARALANTIQRIQQSPRLSAKELLNFNELLNTCYTTLR